MAERAARVTHDPVKDTILWFADSFIHSFIRWLRHYSRLVLCRVWPSTVSVRVTWELVTSTNS